MCSLCHLTSLRQQHISRQEIPSQWRHRSQIYDGFINILPDSHVVINRPPSGGNSFEWCRNADVWCILYVFGHCPQQNKEIELDNVITNDYMLFYWIDQKLVDFWLATWVSDIFWLSCITLHKFRLTISFAGFYSDMLYQSSNYVTIRSLNLYWNN